MTATSSLAEDFSVMDGWFRQPESVTELFQQKPVAETSFATVKDEHKAKALALLEKETFQSLTESEAMQYGAKAVESQKYFYLVRAITLNRPHGSYSLYFTNGVLLVRYSTMGNTVPPAAHEALVVALPEKLKEAYVLYHVVQ